MVATTTLAALWEEKQAKIWKRFKRKVYAFGGLAAGGSIAVVAVIASAYTNDCCSAYAPVLITGAVLLAAILLALTIVVIVQASPRKVRFIRAGSAVSLLVVAWSIWALTVSYPVSSRPAAAADVLRALGGFGIFTMILSLSTSFLFISKLSTYSYLGFAILLMYRIRACVWCCKKRTWTTRFGHSFNYIDVEDTSMRLVREEPQAPGTLRFVCLSDTHLAHRHVHLPPGDVLVHCGDVLFLDRGHAVGPIKRWRGYQDGTRRLRRFGEWMDSLPYEHKVVVAGNHDKIFEDLGAEKVAELLPGTEYLCNSSTKIRVPGYKPVKIYGLPNTPWGGSQNIAFQRPYNDPKLQKHYDDIPSDTNVLLTHDYVIPGDTGLGQAVLRVKPRFHVGGHIHQAYGVHFTHVGSTSEVSASESVSVSRDEVVTTICASTCDSMYMPTHPPIVFDVPLVKDK